MEIQKCGTYVLGLLLLTSCAVPSQAPEVREYIKLYEGLTHRRVENETIVLTDPVDTDPYVVGVCTTPGNYIQLSKSFWFKVGDSTRIVLLFHELGHCDLEREHIEEYFPDGCPKSFMNPVLIDPERCYPIHKDEMLKELLAA